MATTTTTTNKPLNPRAQDLSPKGYNRAALYSGKALDFDGVNDYIGIPSTFDSTIVNGAFTFVATINKSNNATDNDRLIDISIDANNTLQIITDDASQRFAVLLISGGVTKVNALTYSPIEFGRIVNVAFTFDGSTLAAFYLNSRAVAAVGSTSIGYGSSGVSIGRRNDNVGSGWFGGTMAGVKLFNVALTAAQVADLYLNPEKIVPDGVASSALKLWLPMMEGAGASAYDGSGNGNDGTINGATWTAGIGAPVAQTALVSWNKGTNLFKYSEQFNQGSAWIPQNGATISANATTAPNGTTTADLLYPSINNSIVARIQSINPTTNGAAYTQSVYVKAAGKNFAALYTMNGNTGTTMWVNLTTGAITNGSGPNVSGRFATDEGNGWWRIGMTDLGNGSTGYMHVYPTDAASVNSVTANGTDGIYLWGGAMVQSTTAGAYIKTNATAQTSAVLVPEGLTAGASIFGTDIITPRNAFALNLDGASWGRVGRNTSVSPTTAITLEAWIKKSTKSGFHHILSRNSTSVYYYSMFTEDATGELCFQGTTSANYKTSGVDVCTGSWVHVLVAYNTTQALFYVNGVLVSTNALTDALTPNSVDLFIGARPSGIQLYDAQLANPRIYNRALTAAEVLRNYNADKAKFGL
jgi:hypothetical protein